MRYEGKEYKCVEVFIGGDCADNCIFSFNLDKDDHDHGVAAIGLTEMGIMITLGGGGVKMFEGLPYQARFEEITPE